MNLVRVLRIVPAVLMLVGPASADPSGQAGPAQLDQLFAELKTACGIEEGRAVEAKIVAIWLRSGDAEVDTMMHWANTALSIGSYELAINYLDTIVVTKPDFAEGWSRRATAYFYLGDFERSLDDIERTLALEPRHFGAIAGLGLVRERQGRLEEALEAFDRALAIDPNLEDIRIHKFLIEDKLGRRKL
jgi:tetratricopeptide (TPR) repeat protein